MKVDTVGVETFYGKLHTELADNDERESPLQGNSISLSFHSNFTNHHLIHFL